MEHVNVRHLKESIEHKWREGIALERKRIIMEALPSVGENPMDVDVDVILPLTQLETTEAVLLDRRLLFSRKATLKLGTLLNSWTAKTLEMRDADSASDMDVDSE